MFRTQWASNWLQWSHGILAMDSLDRIYAKLEELVASMEPWHFSHG